MEPHSVRKPRSRLGSAPALPVEILEEIFQPLSRDHPTLASCSYVCRLWAACARKFLYRHIWVEEGFGVRSTTRREGLRRIARGIPDLRTFIHANPDLKDVITSLSIHWWSLFSTQDSGVTTGLDRIISSLPRLTRFTVWEESMHFNKYLPLVDAYGISPGSGGDSAPLAANRLYISLHADLSRFRFDPSTLVGLFSLFGDIGSLQVGEANINNTYEYTPEPRFRYKTPSTLPCLLVFDDEQVLSKHISQETKILAMILSGRKIHSLYMQNPINWPALDACAVDGTLQHVEALRLSFSETMPPTSGRANTITTSSPQLRVLQVTADVFLGAESFMRTVCRTAEHLEVFIVEFSEPSIDNIYLGDVELNASRVASKIAPLLLDKTSLRKVICVPAADVDPEEVEQSMDEFGSYFGELRKRGMLTVLRTNTKKWTSHQDAMAALSE